MIESVQKKKNSGRKAIKELKINHEIDAEKVFLIDQKGKAQGAVSLDQAQFLAYEAELDLVQINSANPPVIKIMDYGKYRYAQEKQESRQKVKTKAPEIKEVRISLKINAHDLDFKTKQAKRFLESGDKVKIVVKLIGREMMFSNRVREVLEKFKILSGGEFEGSIEKMGTRFSAILAPSKVKLKNQDENKNS